MASYEDLLRQHLGQPVQAGAQQLGQSADDAMDKLRALQQVSQQNAPQPQQMQHMAPPVPDQSGAAIANGEMWQRIQQHDAQMKAQMDAEDAQHAKDEAEFDPSQYKDVPKDKFSGLKSKLQDEEE